MAKDYIIDQDKFEILGGYFSPVSDGYGKKGLAYWKHRVNMCDLAVKDNSWVMVDSWEPSQQSYVRTAAVLDHFDQELNQNYGGVLVNGGKQFFS
jgi:nicotinamide mononucleotide adenylyltransferase